MCGKLSAILTCEHSKEYRSGCSPLTCSLLHRVYRIGAVNFGIHTDAPNIRHLGSKPESTLCSSCHGNRPYFLPNEWDRLSYFSVLARIGARYCVHGDGTTVSEVYAYSLSSHKGIRGTHPIDLRNIGTHAPGGGRGCHVSEAGSIIFLAYISLLICETSESP